MFLFLPMRVHIITIMVNAQRNHYDNNNNNNDKDDDYND